MLLKCLVKAPSVLLQHLVFHHLKSALFVQDLSIIGKTTKHNREI